MNTEVIIDFCISGFKENAIDLLKSLDIKVEHSGEIKVDALSFTENSVSVISEGEESEFEDMIQAVLNKVYHLRYKLPEIKADIQLNCVFYVNEQDQPTIQFPCAILSQLVDLGASISVDIYHLTPYIQQ
jgi:hypothetical protein